MYVPATPALTVTALPPNAIAAGEAAQPPIIVAPQVTRLHIRSAILNVLDGRAASIAGSLRVTAPKGRDCGRWAQRRRAGVSAWRRAQPGARAQLRRACARGHRWQRGSSPAGAGRQAGGRSTAARTGARGHFRLRYRADRIGSELLRVRFAGAPGEDGPERAVGRLNVYRLAEASWYGGEGSLACGGWLTSATLGVANKTLPCGTLVTLRYDGHTVRVPVIDRGPYVAGREYDLTEATKRALGFEGVGEVWATS